MAPLCVWKMAPPPWVPLIAVAWLPEKVLFSTKRRPPSLAIAPPAQGAVAGQRTLGDGQPRAWLDAHRSACRCRTAAGEFQAV
ncbi:MAG: hypothetical protein H6646_00345 [Anaerolineales bacterium]|nr:hypothetical protein [Anaerolineales bacterium]